MNNIYVANKYINLILRRSALQFVYFKVNVAKTGPSLPAHAQQGCGY